MKRRISHGQATRSTFTFSRVTLRIAESFLDLEIVEVGDAIGFRPTPGFAPRGECVVFDFHDLVAVEDHPESRLLDGKRLPLRILYSTTLSSSALVRAM